MSQRLTRKEIKQKDSFLEQVGSMIEFVAENLRTLIWIAVGIIAGVVIVLVVLGMRRSRETEADRELAGAIRILEAPAQTGTATPVDGEPVIQPDESRRASALEAFDSLIDEYSGTRAADIASAYLGGLAAETGDLEAARAAWERYLESDSTSLLATEVEVNLMALDRAQGRGDELVTRLRARLSSGDSTLPPDLLLFQLALTLEDLGRTEEAVATYQRIIDDYSNSTYAAEARSRMGPDSGPFTSGI